MPTRRSTLRERLSRQVQDLRRQAAVTHHHQALEDERRIPDARLVPAAIATWGAALLCTNLPGSTIAAAAPIVAATLIVSAMIGWFIRPGQLTYRARGPNIQSQKGRHLGTMRKAAPTVLLALFCVLAVLMTIALRLWNTQSQPLAQVAQTNRTLVLTLEVTSALRLLGGGKGPPHVIFEAEVVRATAGGQSYTGRLPVEVIAKTSWNGLQVGDMATTAGRVVTGDSSDAGLLRPTTDPLSVRHSTAAVQQGVAAIRQSWISTVHTAWDAHSPDVAGLLPGMVMGDRNGLDSALNDSMKTVGLTHLTAVSGANCTLVLASLLLLFRSVRAPRMLAVAGSVLGLLGFVLIVGPDPSVLRAAVMGGIGAMAILSGRPKRVGALLSTAIVVLLVADPWLATDYAFVLSSLATLGLHLVGKRCVRWISALLPMWLAQALAIPLAAQLFCAPVIVLLQARLTPLTIPANMLVAPVVALVTTLGTLGMVVAVLCPAFAFLCALASGVGAWWVGCVARFMSGLPGASLPWPEGPQGVALMAVLNAAILTALVAVVDRNRRLKTLAWLGEHVPPQYRHQGFPALTVAAALLAAWWTAAAVQL